MNRTLAICGTGGLGRELLELARQINEKENRWDNFIFVTDEVGGSVVNGVKVFSEEELRERNLNLDAIVGIGEPSRKEKVLENIRAYGWDTPTLIHPGVHIPDTTSVGKGAVIQENCFISCNVLIEDDVYIQPNANIGHDCVLRVGSVISGLCHLAGGVQIGRYTYLGMSSCYKEHVSVGDGSIVGMGAVVYHDIGDGVIAVGNPARVMKRNEERRVFK